MPRRLPLALRSVRIHTVLQQHKRPERVPERARRGKRRAAEDGGSRIGTLVKDREGAAQVAG